MIIDSIALGGDKAYFDFGSQHNQVKARIPREPLGPGESYAVSGISIQLEGKDLRPLFHRHPKPLLRVSVQKEMFPALFAAPYEHRVHNISGYEDFNRGDYAGCKAVDVEGVPTIVSVGEDGQCSWTSKVYQMPEGIVLDKIAWDMAASRLTPEVNFTYSIELLYWVHSLSPQNARSITVVSNADPTNVRNANLNLRGKPVAYAIVFSATVNRDANVYESHPANPFEILGAPLLRAVYLLEKVEPPVFEFYSLKELLDHSLDTHLFETPGPKITKLTATIRFKALLRQSDNQVASNSRNPALADNYEYVEVTVARRHFTFVEAKAIIRETITPPKAVEQP